MIWPVGRLGRLASAWPSNVDKHTIGGQPTIRLCNYTDVYKNDSITADLAFMTATASEEQITRFRLHVGDTVITKDSETADDIGIPAFVRYESPDLICGYHLAIVRPNTDVAYPRYVYWALSSDYVFRQWSVLAAGVTRVGIRSTDLERVSVPLPTRQTQQAIAGYLDRETAQIDTLIAKQADLITSLRQRRQAVIASMALSDYSPLASVPRSSTPVGAHFSVVLGKMLDAGKPPNPDDVTLPYVRAANIQDGGLDLTSTNEMPYSGAEASRLDLRKDDLLVVEGGAVGTAVLIDADMPGWSFQKTVNRVRSTGDASTAWLGYVLRAYRDAGVIDIFCDGSTIAHFTAEKLRALRVPAIDPSRQRDIAAQLDEQTSKIDLLISKAERFIALAKQRRTALITAAVTGQIDVGSSA